MRSPCVCRAKTDSSPKTPSLQSTIILIVCWNARAKLPIATTLNGTVPCDRGYSPSLFGGASSSCALVALEPLPLSWSRLEMWCDRRRIAPARNHGASHLVTIGIEGPLQEEGTTCALLLVGWKKSRQVQHMRVPLNVRAWPQLMR